MAALVPMVGRSAGWMTGCKRSLVLALLGMLFLLTPLGTGLRLRSFDWPFRFHPPAPPEGVVLVEMDDASHRELGQPFEGAWDRALHVRLLDALSAHRARAVVFDILFDTPGTDPDVDRQFAAKLRSSGNVVLAALQARPQVQGDAVLLAVQRALEPLGSAAPWGLANLPLDTDGFIRRHPVPGDHPTLAWKAASLLGTTLPAPTRPRWIRFYGPPGTLTRRSYAAVLSAEHGRTDELEGKVVFVGAATTVGYHGTNRSDEHATPFTRWSGRSSSGVELHATLWANLQRRDWLEELPLPVELLAVGCVGLLCGLGMSRLRPEPFTLMGLALASAAVLVGMLSQDLGRFWLPWLIPCVVQVPTAIVWCWVAVARRHLPRPTRYEVFISYRRDHDAGLAQRVADALRRRGLRTFLDVTSLGGGDWRRALMEAIHSASNVVAVLSPGTLDERDEVTDVLRLELEMARAAGCNIIPLVVGGFAAVRLPDSAAWLGELQAVEYHTGYSEFQFQGTIDTLVRLCQPRRKVGPPPESQRSGDREPGDRVP